MARSNKLTIKEIRKETPDCVSISFDVPAELSEDYQFIPGQYLTLRTEVNGEDLRRSYSICTAPHEKDLRVAVKKVDGGAFSTYANEILQPGDMLDVMKPMGRFTRKAKKGNNYLLFAAGSGITPVISIIKDILLSEPDAMVTLVYGNKGYDHIIFREELINLKNLYLDRFSVHHILSREIQGEAIYNGRIDRKKCDHLFNTILKDQIFDEFFICGPEEMIMAVREYLKESGVDESKVRFELFTSGTPAVKKTAEVVAEQTGKQVGVIIDGVRYDFKLPEEGETVLDAAHRVGADLPFACKGGVCCTCRAKVLEGEVKMDLNYSLEQDEVDSGFVLTCQSHPVTDSVLITFDEV